jgi:hypothetical protein
LDDRPFVSLMFRVEAFDDVPCNVVVLFTTIVYGRHSRGAVTVVRLLGDEPINIVDKSIEVSQIEVFLYKYNTGNV